MIDRAAYEEIQANYAAVVNELTLLKTENNDLKWERDLLKQRLANITKQKYVTTSERILSDDRQLPIDKLDFGSTETPKKAEEVLPATIVEAHTRNKRTGRKPLPENLPREIIPVEPAQTCCAECNKELATIGTDVTEILEHTPATLIVKEYHRARKACSSCKDSVFQAELPVGVQPIDGARVGPGLLAHLIISKYVDHLPLYRQETIFERLGILLPRQRMSDWLLACEYHLECIWKRLLQEARSSPYLQSDETTIKVQDNETPGVCHTGWLWVLHAPLIRIAVFRYDEHRSSDAAREILGDYGGVVQTDDYSSYSFLSNRIACLAHIRRKFVEAQASDKPRCSKILTLIRELYDIEKKQKDSSPEERQAYRAKHSVPILTKLHALLTEYQTQVLPKSTLRGAIEYAFSNWERLLRFLTDGTFHIDNNAIEREIRPVAVGRKNWLFAGSHDGARRAAMIYSVIATCKLNRVDPYSWFLAFFNAGGATHISTAQIHDWMPHRWTA